MMYKNHNIAIAMSLSHADPILGLDILQSAGLTGGIEINATGLAGGI